MLWPADVRRRALLRMRLMRTLRWFLPNRGNPGSAPADLARPGSREAVPDYLVWSVIDWHFRHQRPQQLSQELARAGRRVFYVSPNFADEREPGFRVEPLGEDGRLYQVFLHLRGASPIYFEPPSDAANRQLTAGARMLFDWARLDHAVSLVEHPFWFGAARAVPHACLVYDRMDYHQGFGTFGAEVASLERALLSEADLTVVSSDWLDKDAAPYAKRRSLIRNAADYRHFAPAPEKVFRDDSGRRVIGYFGAIADWLDLDLVAAVGERFPECLVVLIGHDQIGAYRRFGSCPNVRLLGERPYSELPFYLHGFDVCLLPRRVMPLTEAMNPVKLYEYLSAGRPVVAVDLPELGLFGDLVYVAATPQAYLEAVGQALTEPAENPLAERRRAFAARQTWEDRARRLIHAVESLPGSL
jgi:glycosyltransferase involved in cell wall biosynthesis